MKKIFNIMLKYSTMFVVGIWDFVFLFFGVPYEEQAKKYDLSKIDPDLRGPDNPKTSHTIYRANRASDGM